MSVYKENVNIQNTISKLSSQSLSATCNQYGLIAYFYNIHTKAAHSEFTNSQKKEIRHNYRLQSTSQTVLLHIDCRDKNNQRPGVL